MTATTRQWVTIVAACAVFSLIVHMGMYTSNHGSGISHIWRAQPSSTNDTMPPQWAAHMSHDITKLGDRLSKLTQKTTAISKLLNTTDDSSESYTTIINKQDELSKQIKDLVTRLDALQPRIDTGITKSDAIDHDVKQVLSTMTSLTSSLTTAGTDRTNNHASLTAEIAKLSATLTTLQSSIKAAATPPKPAPVFVKCDKPLHHWKLNDKETHAEKVALIIESRPIHRLIRTVTQFMSVMKEDWEFQIWFSNQNEEMLRNSPEIQTAMCAGRLKMYPMGRDVFDIPWYNQLMMHNVSFWEFVGGKHMLIFQVDAVACANSPKKIEEFLDYDYCGAPWASPWYGDAGGNGGLSLRGRDATLRCARDWRGYGANEDGYFTECVAHAEERGERKICRRELAKTFSVETIYYPTPWGVHNAWQYLKPEETAQLQQWCPEMADARLPHSRDPPPS